MRRRRFNLFSWLADAMIRGAVDRPSAAEVSQRMKSMSFDHQTSRLGVRMTSSLRDRLRRGWLRLRND